jgi:hypothetical protein
VPSRSARSSPGMRWVAVASLAAAVMALESLCFAQRPGENPGIGFKAVEETLTSLIATRGARVAPTTSGGWLIVDEPEKDTQWSFAPPEHHAYPMVVRRAVKRDSSGNLYIEMSGLCENEWSNCEDLFEEFKRVNERIRQRVQLELVSGRVERVPLSVAQPGR